MATLTPEETEELRAADEFNAKRATEPVVFVRMRKPNHVPSETDVDSRDVWAWKIAGWTEV